MQTYMQASQTDTSHAASQCFHRVMERSGECFDEWNEWQRLFTWTRVPDCLGTMLALCLQCLLISGLVRLFYGKKLSSNFLHFGSVWANVGKPQIHKFHSSSPHSLSNFTLTPMRRRKSYIIDRFIWWCFCYYLKFVGLLHRPGSSGVALSRRSYHEWSLSPHRIDIDLSKLSALNGRKHARSAGRQQFATRNPKNSFSKFMQQWYSSRTLAECFFSSIINLRLIITETAPSKLEGIALINTGSSNIS